MRPRLLLVACVLFVPTIASAQPGPAAAELTDAEAAEYLAFYERGLELHEAHQYEEALLELERARALLEHPNVLINIATALGHLGRFREAIPVLERQLELAAGSESSGHAAQLLQLARAQLATLVVHLEPSEAELVVDGRSIEGTGALREVLLDPGDHEVEARPAGHEVAAAQAHLDAGGAGELTLSLEASVEPVPEEAVHSASGLETDATVEADRGAADDEGSVQPGPDPLAGAVTLTVGGAVFLGGAVAAIVGAVDYAQFSNHEVGTSWEDVADSYHRAPAVVSAGSVVAAAGLVTALVGVVLLTTTTDEQTTVAIGPSRLELRGRF